MTKIKRLDRSSVQDNLTIVFLCLMFVFQMIRFSSMGWSMAHDKVCVLGMLSECALVFFAALGKKKNCVEVKLLTAYIFWLFITCIINSDVSFQKSHEYIRIFILSVSTIYCGFVLEPKKRKIALIAVSVVICAYYTVLAAAGIYASIIGEDVHLPFLVTATTYKEGGTQILTIAGYNRNVSSMWFALACCMTLYLITVCRRKLVRVLLALIALVMYVTVSLTMSRTTMGSLAVAFAMFAMIVVSRKLQNKSTKVKAAALLCTIIIILPLSYKGCDYMCRAVTHFAVEYNSQTEDNDYTAQENETEKKELEDIQFKDYRNASSLRTLEGRTYIWKAGIQAIRMEPQRLLKGALVTDYMTLPDLLHDRSDPAFLLGYTSHMHNFLADPLMITGLPGFAFVVAFTVLLVIRMIKVFFAAHIEMSVKVLTLPIAASLVKNMLETIIFWSENISNTLFCFIAGVFLAYSYELLPRKKAEENVPLPE